MPTDNPLGSQITDILLINDKEDGEIFSPENSLTKGIHLFNKNKNVFCQFEKIEMIESVFEPYPKGTLVVRDTADIISQIKNRGIDTILIFTNNSSNASKIIVGSITSTSYINNAASETEQNFVAINFTNQVYKFTEQSSAIQIFEKEPYIRLVNKAINYINIIFNLATSSISGDSIYKTFDKSLQLKNLRSAFVGKFNDKTENWALYKGLETIEDRTSVPIDNSIQYASYLASYAVPKKYDPKNPITAKDVTDKDYEDLEIKYDSTCPRFLFWTGWNNKFNLKYFYQDLKKDVIGQNYKKIYGLNYAVFDSDNQFIEQEIDGENLKLKKIYSFITNPADQFMSKKYFYVRKTPKLLNNTKGNTSASGNTFSRLSFQFQDEGEKYDYQIISSEGTISDVPHGANELVDKSFWGFYDSMNPLDNVSHPTHIGHDFGYQKHYIGNTFMGITGMMPYVDCPEMWKNQFDLTPLHPNLNNEMLTDNDWTHLEKILTIRYKTFIDSQGETKQLEKIREIERQNFVSYVLCCLKEQKEEEFFAAILGYQAEVEPYNQRGINEEALKYRYYWAKLKLINDPYAIPDITPHEYYETEANIFRAFENQVWILDIGEPPYIEVTQPITGLQQSFTPYVIPNGEWSGITNYNGGNTLGLMAVNLSERTNWYSLLGITYNTQYTNRNSQEYGFAYYGMGNCGASGGYYSPGWHAQSVKDENFEKIKYRALSHDIKDYVERVDPKGITYPSLYQDMSGMTSFIKRHIVRMHKTPVVKLLKESGITDQKTLFAWDGKFIYWFDSANILDGPCD